MKARNQYGLSLVELLVVIFLMGIVGYLSVQYFPIFRAYARNTASDGLAQTLNQLLRRMSADIRSSASPGFNHVQDGKSWSLYLVLRLPPTVANTESWSNQVVLYQYQDQSHKLIRTTLKSPTLPDGQPMLNGDEPIRLEPMMFQNQPITDEIKISSVTCQPWPDPKQPLNIELSSPEIKTVHISKDFSRFLNS